MIFFLFQYKVQQQLLLDVPCYITIVFFNDNLIMNIINFLNLIKTSTKKFSKKKNFV